MPVTGAPRTILVPTGVGASKEIPVPLEKVSWALSPPDDAHIMFGGAEHGHAFRCYIQEIGTGKIKAVSPEGTGSCEPAPDGSSIAALSPEGKLAVYPLSDQPPRVVPGDTAGLEPVRWSSEGLFVYRNALPARIIRIDPLTGKQTVARELAPSDSAGLIGISPVVLSPDAKAYAYSYRRTLSELYVVEGLK